MENKEKLDKNSLEEQDILATAKANKNTIVGFAVAVVVIVAAALCWYMVSQNQSNKADEAIALADSEPNDSIAFELFAQAAKMGHASGNRAKAMCAAALFEKGEYQQAADYLADCSFNDNLVASGAATLEGDCYVNLDQLDKALGCYRKAVSKADGNPMIVPFVLIKEANVYHAQQKYAQEAQAYQQIIENYPQFVSQSNNMDVRALYERARALAAAN